MAKKNNSVYAALAVNLLIAATKFVAGGITRSSAMISEGIHSLVDSTNQLLLLHGLKQSKRRPDKKRPFGYGKELYFWSFMVSVLIFGLGGGLSIAHGVQFLLHPHELANPMVNYIVLGLSIIFELVSCWFALKEFNAARGDMHWWHAVKTSKNPITFLVLFEDLAAVAGLLIVLVFTFLTQWFDLPALDGVASILVGLLLGGVAIFLGSESRSLLMGEGIAPETQAEICAMVERDPAVTKAVHILSTYQSPESVIIMLVVAFKKNLNTTDITTAVDRIRHGIKSVYPFAEYIVIQPQASSKSSGMVPLESVK
jgi:cation diffusion facilitator family transporter